MKGKHHRFNNDNIAHDHNQDHIMRERERDNHIATSTSPQPRGGTTPASSWEAATLMKMTPGALPHPGRVPEQRLLSPKLGFWIVAELGCVSGKILRYGSELGQEGIYGRRGDARRCPRPPGAHQARARTRQGGPRHEVT